MMTAVADRIVDCPHRVECGACSLLCQPYGVQLERKRRRLMDVLEEKVRYRPRQILPTLPSPQVEGYRSRAKMAISTDRERRSMLGYFQRQTREVVDAPHCGVLVPELLETTHGIRRLLNSSIRIPFALRYIDLRCGSDPNLQHLTLVVRDETLPRLPIEALVEACPHVAGIAVNLNPGGGAQVIKGRIEPVFGVREVYVDSASLSLRVSPGSFFQVNLGLLPEVHSRMAAFLGAGKLLVDLYAGVGTHGLALRRRFGRVLCVEGVRSSVADARATIKAAQVDNVEVLASPIHRALRRLRSEKPEAIVLNPSRVGADPLALEMIIASPARLLAYLSCDPATLTRDLAMLIDGGFELVTVQAVDMMPQTRQVEALALLRR
ncbi:MAG: 23S rRNA (uracil(1939)-C(5))-methyltransferase RlmD [Thermoanaerobaculales bacterium]|nr:23S rRNA (uracil(1939)-C(5))-methyltransferase RlmD [Thermoanaerobaculales bacterium]